MKKLLRLSILILLVILVIPAGNVIAADEQPTDVLLYDIVIFDDLIETGDSLAFVPYLIEFDTEPSLDITNTYIFRLIDDDGVTELGSTTAYPAYNDGYGKGVVSFYFDTGLTDDTPYIFQVQQNPLYYDSPTHWDFAIDESNYSDASDQSAALRAAVIDSATILSSEFSVQLLVAGEMGDIVLSSYGELYFLNAIPGLQNMCSSLFSIQLSNPDFSKRSWSTTFADNLQTKYSGTFIEDFMTGFGGMFSIETSPAMNALSIFLFLALIFVSMWKWKATAIAAVLDGYCLLLNLMLMGFFSMIWAGFIAFISIVVGGGILLFKRS